MKRILSILLILATLCMFLVSCNNVDTDINADKNTDSSIKTDTDTGEVIDTNSDISSDNDEIIDTGSDKTTDTNETTDTDSDEISDTNNDTSSDTTIDTESDTTTDTESDTTTDTDTDTDTDDDSAVKAPNFHMLDYNGNEVTLDSFIGKAVVLNFFASWCPPCKAEMPDFEEAYKTYGNDIEFVMVSHLAWGNDTIEKVKTFYSNSYFDYKYEGYYSYGLESIPRTVIIDADGNVYKYYTGMINYETLVSDIESVLNK